MLEQSLPDHNFWIVAAIIAGALLLWLAADFFIGILFGNFIHVGMGEDDDDC